jgi:hypothetical protein
MANSKKFKIGSEGDKGEHIRSTSGWPYSIYVEDNEIGGCDRVLCHGIQNLDDAERLLEICNHAKGQAIKSHLQLFA